MVIEVVVIVVIECLLSSQRRGVVSLGHARYKYLVGRALLIPARRRNVRDSSSIHYRVLLVKVCDRW